MRRLRRWHSRDDGHRNMGLRHEILHWLHQPAQWGRQEKYEVRHPVWHKIHLIPGSLMERSCARAERKRGV